jgi:hypothetical protein
MRFRSVTAKPTHGGLTPPALGATARRPVAGEITPFAMHKRTFTRAARRQPAVARQSRWRERQCTMDESDNVRLPSVERTVCTRAARRQPAVVFPNRVCDCHAMTFRVSRSDMRTALHGGLTPPLLVACATYRLRCAFPIRNGGSVPRGAYAPRSWCTAWRPVDRKNNAFCDAQTHVRKSGGREPAVGIANAGAVALVCHGQLTLTALGVANAFRRKNDFCDAQTHAHKSGGREPAVMCTAKGCG